MLVFVFFCLFFVLVFVVLFVFIFVFVCKSFLSEKIHSIANVANDIPSVNTGAGMPHVYEWEGMGLGRDGKHGSGLIL